MEAAAGETRRNNGNLIPAVGSIQPSRSGGVSQSAFVSMLIIGLLMGSLGACSEDSPAFSDLGRNLLSQAPAETLATDARLRPTKVIGWGRHDGGGWGAQVKGPDSAGHCFLTIQGKEAHLDFEVARAVDRHLKVSMRAEVEPVTLEVLLNGTPIGNFEVKSIVQDFDVRVLATHWLVGENRLTLRETPGPSHGVAVYEVLLHPGEQVQFKNNLTQLGTNTEAVWNFELAESAILHFELRGDSDGLAKVSLEAMDTLSGQVRRLGRQEFSVKKGDAIVGKVPVPDPEGRVMQVRIGWEATGGTESLSVRQLVLSENKPLNRPPILFISIDTLSAKNMSVYGYARETTPNLSEFAEDSISFAGARSNAPWTIPSYTSQFTGIYPRANLRRSRDDGRPRAAWETYIISEHRWTLGEMLRAAGYVTGAIVDNLWLAKVPGFSQGFDVYDTQPALIPRNKPEGGMRMVFPRAIEFLDEHWGRPIFCFTQIVDVHGPYLPEPSFKGVFEKEVDPKAATVLPVVRMAPAVFGGVPDTIARVRFTDQESMPDRVAAEYYQANYDEKILELDSVLGEFFDSLKAKGFYDDLLIVFSADHGESMIDHDFFFRHGITYDSAIHVPLIIKMPGQAYAGTRIDDPVQLVDLYPTLADVLGLPLGQRRFLHGRSLLGAIKADPLEDVPLLSQTELLGHSSLIIGEWKLVESWPKGLPLDALLSAPSIQEQLYRRMPEVFVSLWGSAPPIGPTKVVDKIKALRQQKPAVHRQVLKYVRAMDPIVELYNVRKDPNEVDNVAAAYPEVVERLQAMMITEIHKAEAIRFESDEAAIHFDPSMVEELQALGYIGEEQ